MSRLFTRTEQTHDLRPTIMSVSGLMLLLLPLTLVSTSLDKRTSLPIGLTGGDGERMLGEGPLEQLRVQRAPEGFVVQASVRTTDVRASAGQVEQRTIAAADLTQLQAVLGRMKQLDPSRTELTLIPAGDSRTAEVVAWMDAARRGPDGLLFPEVVLEVSQ